MSEKQEVKTLNIEIDGKSYQANPGQMVIQVADNHGIYIPRFCYHKKLSVAANCRMCLVDIEGARKPSPACATPVMDGMKVFTKSEKTLSYQKKVMEFLLINHPLDCPICDQGGECELQDIAMGYGNDVSHYNETKRAFDDPSLGSLIATDMTRCIQCTRCVRFGEEIAGDKELGAMGRGDHTEIGTYVARTVDSELSGNMIDLCPVGALTSKPFRFNARAWELLQRPTISAADGIGAHLFAHVRRNKLMRIVPREHDRINETWIADKDRFAYTGLYTEDRLETPVIKKRDQWQDVSWEEALDFVKVAIETTLKQDGANSIAAIASENSTTEELYLLQKLIRSLGSNHVDTRLKQGSIAHGVTAGMGFNCELKEIESSDFILLIGSQLRKEYPLVNHRVRKAVLDGAQAYALNSTSYDFNYPIETLKIESGELVHAMTAMLKALCQRVKLDFDDLDALQKYFAEVSIPAGIESVVEAMLRSENPVVLLGQDALTNTHFDVLALLNDLIIKAASAKGGILSFNANAKGALAAGMHPYFKAGVAPVGVNERGLGAIEILKGKGDIKLAILHNIEPEFDTIMGMDALKTLEGIDIVVVMSPYITENMRQYADIILPIASHFETDGSFMNISGIHQSFKAVVDPYAEIKTAWKVLRVLGNLLNIAGFDYQRIADVFAELNSQPLHELTFDVNEILRSGIPEAQNALIFSPKLSMYRTDHLLRRATPLAQTRDNQWAQSVHMSVVAAEQQGLMGCCEVVLEVEDRQHRLDLIIDEKLADMSVFLPFALFNPENQSQIRLFHPNHEDASV
ncbi:MAG: NADH-quinone oxidoreductase subunit NuoG [Francisellaceae bacterium]